MNLSSTQCPTMCRAPPPPTQPFTVTKCNYKRRTINKIAAVETISSSPTELSKPNFPPSKSRYLILLRHAASSWDNPSLRDHDRPLSKSGELDAEKLSAKLKRLGWVPQLVLCSDAVRSRETVRCLRLGDGIEVRYVSSFYSVAAMDGETAEHLRDVVCKYSSDDIVTVMCMGHNKGWEEAASMFTGTEIELKTCNAALLEGNGSTWEEAFALAGRGGWTLLGIVKPED